VTGSDRVSACASSDAIRSVRERLEELQDDFMFKHHFPTEGKAISSTDIRALRDNFAEIASGKVVVKEIVVTVGLGEAGRGQGEGFEKAGVVRGSRFSFLVRACNFGRAHTIGCGLGPKAASRGLYCPRHPRHLPNS
jgi:hypothetical protein